MLRRGRCERSSAAKFGQPSESNSNTASQVYRQPRVAVLSTGDEVVEPSTQDLGPGQIRDANRSMLLAASSAAGAETLDLGIARDTEGETEACFSRALEEEADMLITSGLFFLLLCIGMRIRSKSWLLQEYLSYVTSCLENQAAPHFSVCHHPWFSTEEMEPLFVLDIEGVWCILFSGTSHVPGMEVPLILKGQNTLTSVIGCVSDGRLGSQVEYLWVIKTL